nr:ArlX2 [Vischeria sp. CAUP Q 202]
MSLQDLKDAGFSAAQLRKAHVGSKRELVGAGYSETEVRVAGYRPASTSKTLVVGLDGSGKTALLCTLTKEPRNDQPTVGYNVQSLTLDDVAFTCYDLAGQEGLRVMWTHYITSDVRSVIFCIDSSDSSRFQEARDTLAAFFNNRALDKVSVLVLATKADLAGAYPIDQIKTKLWVGDTLQNHHWKIAAVTTDDREGMIEAISFLAQPSPKAKAQYESDEAEDDAKKQKCSIM